MKKSINAATAGKKEARPLFFRGDVLNFEARPLNVLYYVFKPIVKTRCFSKKKVKS
jgi:hypothetical protein